MLFRNIRIHNPPTDDISEWLPNFRISFYHRLKIALYHITIAMIVVSSDDDMGNTMQRTNLLAGAACWVQIASFDWRPKKKKIKQQYTRISHNKQRQHQQQKNEPSIYFTFFGNFICIIGWSSSCHLKPNGHYAWYLVICLSIYIILLLIRIIRVYI